MKRIKSEQKVIKNTDNLLDQINLECFYDFYKEEVNKSEDFHYKNMYGFYILTRRYILKYSNHLFNSFKLSETIFNVSLNLSTIISKKNYKDISYSAVCKDISYSTSENDIIIDDDVSMSNKSFKTKYLGDYFNMSNSNLPYEEKILIFGNDISKINTEDLIYNIRKLKECKSELTNLDIAETKQIKEKIESIDKAIAACIKKLDN